MIRAHPQLEMQPLYGLCHAAIHAGYELFFRGEVVGVENIPASGPFLVAANHASHLDPPFIGAQVPRQMSFFARKSLWIGGAASRWLDSVGTIPVDRDGGQDVGALKRVLRSLEKGRGIIVFPEGTRSRDGNLQPAKPGVGFIVCKSRVPVIPARIFGSFLAFGKRSRFPRLGTSIDIVFGAPLEPSSYDDPSAGRERYQVASQRIMDAIARLARPRPPVI